MANKIIVENKINKEAENNRLANDRGVGSTDLLEEIILFITSFEHNSNYAV